jgi:diguanylate cyclase (GGDEF)-like protein
VSRIAVRLSLAAAAFGLVVTLASVFLPFVQFAYRNPNAHIALDAIEAVIALVAAYMVFGRFRERRLLRDALLVYALLVFAATNLALSVLPRTAFVETAVLEWTSLITRLTGALAFLVASMTSRTISRIGRSLPTVLPLAAILTIPLVALVVGAFGSLPFGVRPVLDPTTAGGPRLEGHPVLLTAQLALVLFFGIAAIRFTVQAERGADPMLRWLGAGAVLASLARVNYFLFPSIYTSFIYTGDVLRLGFYLALLAGASAEIRAYWRRLEGDRIERERLIAELEELSLTDALTGLKNRRSFVSVTEQELKLHERSERALHCVFIDLDDMKGINDRFGHEAGDAALRETADLLRSTFRDSDLVARLGGDEFCVLIAEGDPERAIERLRGALRERQSEADAPYPLMLSVGLATYDPARHRSVEDLVAAADRKMYEDKTSAVRP